MTARTLLSYCDALLAARAAGRAAEVLRLLSLPESRVLPSDVIAELRTPSQRARVPLCTLQLRYRMAHLEPDSVTVPDTSRRRRKVAEATARRRGSTTARRT